MEDLMTCQELMTREFKRLKGARVIREYLRIHVWKIKKSSIRVG